MNIKITLKCLVVFFFLSCGSMYQPSTFDSIQAAINEIKKNARSHHGMHKKQLVMNWGTPANIRVIDDLEVYQYYHETYLPSPGVRFGIEIDMFVEQDTVINSKVKPKIN